MRTTLRTAVIAALLTLGIASAPPAVRLMFAQTALTATTLGAALAAPAQGSPATVITLAAGTGVSVGTGIAVDNEYMVVQSATPQTTRWNVARGQSGTSAGAHASGAGVLLGASNNFAFTSAQPVGPCTSTLVQQLPFVVVGAGGVSIYNCPAVNTLAGSAASAWDQYSLNGYVYSRPARYTGWTYVTLGALTIQNGTMYIGSAGALAMTLAAPSLAQNGVTMNIMASTAQAHTITYTAGFWGNTTSSDVATFGGAIGDFIVVQAVAGSWRVLAQKNVTIA